MSYDTSYPPDEINDPRAVQPRVGEPMTTKPVNPFSASRLRPGAIPFVFPGGMSVDGLVDRLEAAGWRGAIVGPHGSGKSTLLAAVIDAVEKIGRPVVLVELHDGQRSFRLDRAVWKMLAAEHGLLVVDGYEQLGPLARLALRTRRRRIGLLVTSHRSVGLPTLAETNVDPQLARQIAERLLEGYPPLIEASEAANALARHDGNLRDTLMELYDLYEAARRTT